MVLKYPGFICICTGAKDCSTGSKANISIQGDKGTILVDSPANTLTTYRLEPVKGTPESKEEIFNHRMTEEFKKFAEYIENKDFDVFEKKMEHSIIVMGILEEARKQTPGTL